MFCCNTVAEGSETIISCSQTIVVALIINIGSEGGDSRGGGGGGLISRNVPKI